MSLDESHTNGIERSSSRRNVLKRAGATGAGLLLGGTGTIASSGSAAAGDCRYPIELSVNAGQSFEMRDEDSLSGDYTTLYHDNNWRLTLVGRDGQTYRFAAFGLFHGYQEDTNGYHDPYTVQEKVKFDAWIEGNDDSWTRINRIDSQSSIHAIYTSDWNDWYQKEKGNEYDQSDIENELDANDFEDPEFPTFLSAAAFVGGIAAGGIGSGALRVGSAVVGALDLASNIAGGSSDCSVNEPETQERIGYHWDYCGTMPLTVHSVEFDVTIGTGESSYTDLWVYQSFEHDNPAYENLYANNVGWWHVHLPEDMSAPALCGQGHYRDKNGHSYSG